MNAMICRLMRSTVVTAILVAGGIGAHSAVAGGDGRSWQVVHLDSGQPLLPNLRGIGVDGTGRVYLSDASNRHVRVFSATGAPLAAWRTGVAFNRDDGNVLGQPLLPSAFAVDVAGHVYLVTDSGIVKFSTTGHRLAAWSVRAEAIAVDPAGHVYVARWSRSVIEILRVSQRGRTTLMSTVRDGTLSPGSTLLPDSFLGIAVNGGGRVYLAASGPWSPCGAYYPGSNTDCEDSSSQSVLLTVSPAGKVHLLRDISPGPFDPFNSDLVNLTVDRAGTVLIADAGTQKIVRFSSTGKQLTSWGYWGCGPGLVASPSSVAVGPNGTVFVANAENGTVSLLTRTGRKLGLWGRCGLYLSVPTGLAMDPQSSELVVDDSGPSDSFGHGLVKVAVAKQKMGQWGEPWMREPQPDIYLSSANIGGVAADRLGNVYVFRYAQSDVLKLPRGSRTASSQGVNCDNSTCNLDGLAVDQAGRLYGSDPCGRVLKISSGHIVATWTDPSSPPLVRNCRRSRFAPGGLTVDATGNAYVIDVASDRVLKFSSTGQVLARWGGPGAGPGQFQFTGGIFGVTPDASSGIAVDGRGDMYVADTGNNRVQELGPDGQVVASWGSLGRAPGKFNGPLGIAVDAAGNVYVADTGNTRIQKLATGG